MIVTSILIIYLLINVILGIYISRSNKKNTGDFFSGYFLAKRSIGGFILAMTMVATFASASSFLGGPGLASSWGLSQVWVASSQIITGFITLGIIGKKLAIISRRINAVSISDYLRARYKSNFIVSITTILLLCFFTAQMIAQFIGGGTLIKFVTGFDYKISLTIFAVVVILYTSFGGFKAVVITDTFQGIIMTFGTFLFLFFVIRAGGGLENIINYLDVHNPGWDMISKGNYINDIKGLNLGYLMSFWVLVGFGVMALPQNTIRSMAFKDTKSMHRAMIYGTVVIFIMMIGMHIAGVFSLPLIEGANLSSTDQIVPYVVLKYMPSWASGLFLAAPLAAVMSTISSLIILASATLVKDLIQSARLNISDKKISTTSFTITFLIGAVAYIIAIYPPDIIVWINLFALGGLEATFFWPLVGGLYSKRANSKCAIISIVVAVVTYLYFHYNPFIFKIHEIVPSLLLSGIAFFISAKLNKKTLDSDVIENCF